MANWSGTYIISAGHVGTSTGSNTSTTFNNTGATWPTGAQSLANFTLRILAGTGSGQERVVLSNTATEITVTSAWTTIPDATSTYEIVLILKNSDHITASFALSNNIICELENSATIYVDGLYTITLGGTSVVRWQKTLNTMVTFEANNRTIQGKANFWGHIAVSNTGTIPVIQFIKIKDVQYGLFVSPNSVGDGSTIRYIWVESLSNTPVAMTTGAPTADITFSNIFATKGTTNRVGAFGATASAFNQTFKKVWVEKAPFGGISWISNGANIQTIKDCVIKGPALGSNINASAGKTHRFIDNYWLPGHGDGIAITGNASNADAGAHVLSRNVAQGSRFVATVATAGTGSMTSAFNDYYGVVCTSAAAFDISNAAAFTSSTSDNDYIAGQFAASPENIDTTNATTSTANPVQYKNLTSARTNAKAVRNRPLGINNVSAGVPTSTSITITFDCTNGVVAGQGSTTINGDSASGQPVLNVASTTGFEVGETVEVGYGTARYETGEIASIGAGTITLTANLGFSHTAVQADTVTKTLRNWALPYVRFGTSSGNYTNETSLPDRDVWGLIWTEIDQVHDGITWAWKQVGHSVTIYNLNPATTYYYKVYGVTPLDEVLEGPAESTFTTAASEFYTDPGENNVRSGTAYKFASATNNRTGNVVVPVAGQVKTGTAFESSGGTTGTYDGSDRWTDPGAGNVLLGIQYKANSLTNNQTGTLESTDPGEPTVLAGVTYKINSVNKTGSLAIPTAAQVADAVWDEDITTHTTNNSAGKTLSDGASDAAKAKTFGALNL
jgi:hypothetical protein